MQKTSSITMAPDTDVTEHHNENTNGQLRASADDMKEGTEAPSTRSKRAAKNRRKIAARKHEQKKPLSPEGGVHAPFPRSTFEDALTLGTTIQKIGSGQKVRRSILFEQLGKAPHSGSSRMMVVNSGKYGITRGTNNSEFLELTELGQQATSPETSAGTKKQAMCDLAIMNVATFKLLYETWKEKRVPSPEIMQDTLVEAEAMSSEHRKECVELFMENAKFLGLLRTMNGAQRLVAIEHMLDEIQPRANGHAVMHGGGSGSIQTGAETKDWNKTCFFIAPIGEADSEQRKHSDMIQLLIERALEREDLKVIRADGISDPGMIGSQIIEHLRKSALVIADLSFHNPNVFYELCFRHTLGMPTVHIIRSEDRVPFDLKDFRTIHINTADKYDLVAKLETYRAEIANHARMALAAGIDGCNNPVTSFSHAKVGNGSSKN